MLWPYAFFAFVTCVLAKAGHPVAAGASILGALFFLATDLRRTPRKFFPVFFVGILLGLWLFNLRSSLISGNTFIPVAGDAQIIGVSRKSVTIETTDGVRLRLTSFMKNELPKKYARIHYRCELQEVPESTFMVFERLSGVKAWCRKKEIQILEEPSGLLVEFRQRTLRFLYGKFERIGSVSEPTGQTSLIAAFLLGDTDDLSAQELDAFRDMGLMHLFAVSGLNIALLFAMLYLPFRAAGFPAVGSALGYAVATGFLLLLDFPVPLLRAWLFMTIALGMRVIDRRIPSWTLLFLTALIVETLFPLSTFSMSFILSFGVTAAILLFYEPIYFCFASTNRALNFVAEHTALTLAAGLPALILGYFLFGVAQPLSLIYNLLLVPFSGLYLFCSLIFLIFEPAKYILIGLDSLYLKFAGWHAAHVMTRFPAAEPISQIISLLFVALLLATLYFLSIRGRLWSARRNLHYVIPVTAVVLLLPYFLTTYPSRAIYAIPNKVWIYSERKLYSSGTAFFADKAASEPKTCFPVNEQIAVATAQIFPDAYAFADHCIVFAGRMKPETWPANAFAACKTLDLFQSKKFQTSGTEWQQMFALFGYRGKVSVRKYFTWYGDISGTCVKEKL